MGFCPSKFHLRHVRWWKTPTLDRDRVLQQKQLFSCIRGQKKRNEKVASNFHSGSSSSQRREREGERERERHVFCLVFNYVRRSSVPARQTCRRTTRCWCRCKDTKIHERTRAKWWGGRGGPGGGRIKSPRMKISFAPPALDVPLFEAPTKKEKKSTLSCPSSDSYPQSSQQPFDFFPSSFGGQKKTKKLNVETSALFSSRHFPRTYLQAFCVLIKC